MIFKIEFRFKVDSFKKLIMNRIEEDFKEWILDKNHPCMMAQTVFEQEAIVLKDYSKLADSANTEQILKDLYEYIDKYDFDSNLFQSFIAVFKDSKIEDEKEFEKLLWNQLTELSQHDKYSWDKTVSSNPENENFSFSLGEKAFYIVGMHPGSSRIARRSPHTCIVFNLHFQFELLRKMGVYHKVRNKIRKRDVELQGFINPCLDDFGVLSEARQYSGRATSKEWKCPFSK